MSTEQRVEITNAVISHGQCSRSFAEKWSRKRALATQLLLARQWPDVQIGGEQIEYLVTAIRWVGPPIRALCGAGGRPMRPSAGGFGGS